MKRFYIIIGIGLLLFASCGQQHQAKKVIQEFVDQHAVDPSSHSSLSIAKFDSTKVLNDSIINLMRVNADTIQRYRKAIKYAEAGSGQKLYVARVTYSIAGKEYCDTYYLNDRLTSVVAFKSN